MSAPPRHPIPPAPDQEILDRLLTDLHPDRLPVRPGDPGTTTKPSRHRHQRWAPPPATAEVWAALVANPPDLVGGPVTTATVLDAALQIGGRGG